MFSVLTLVVFYLDKYDIYKPFLPLNHFLSKYIVFLSKHNISHHKQYVKQNIHVSKYFIYIEQFRQKSLIEEMKNYETVNLYIFSFK